MMARTVRSSARRLAAAITLAGLLGLAGCGIPAERDPHALQPPAPFQNVPTATPQATTPMPGSQAAVLYLTRNNQLVPVSRPIENPQMLLSLLYALAASPTEEEQQQGLTSALAGTTVVSGVTVTDGLVTVMLAEPGLEVFTQFTQGLAIAQIVCTLDNREDVTGVVFERAGLRVSVPRGDGTQTEEPLTSNDYANLLEPR
jgi:hypothetical protein